MMTEAELNAELADLADVLALAADAEPWSAAWASRQSLLMRQNELFDAAARLGDEFELEVQIAGPVVVPNSVPACTETGRPARPRTCSSCSAPSIWDDDLCRPCFDERALAGFIFGDRGELVDVDTLMED
jgi:hypothetical protein